MKTWFRVKSQLLQVEQILNAVRLPHERIVRIGEPLNKFTNKTHEWNKVSFLISETSSFYELNNILTDVITPSVINVNEIKNSYKYIDIYLDNPAFGEDFVIKNEVILLLSKYDIQIELEIERQL